MHMDKIRQVLNRMGLDDPIISAVPFCSEEDGTEYNVWKLRFSDRELVLKMIPPREKEVYSAFFPTGGGCVPTVHGFACWDGDEYMLMEYIDGETMCRYTREELICLLDSLIELQDRYWCAEGYDDTCFCFSECLANREKRLAHMGDLAPAFSEYLTAFRTVPRTLCNDDMLPFNVLVSDSRTVIIDWEFGGILPYPCALARFLAYGEDQEDTLFYLTDENRDFALDYYYTKFISTKGIRREDYERTMKLFFFKEYSEWVYCANSSGDLSSPYYIKYSKMAKQLAEEICK